MADLRDKFEEVRKLPPETDLEVLRQNYFVQAKIHGSDEASIGGLDINTSGRKTIHMSGKGKSKKNTTEEFLLFHDFISDLEQKYGQDFAENWAAELLDEDTYNELMTIEDQDKRRMAIAKAIQDGISDGTIDPESIDDNPDLAQWLQMSQDQLNRISDNTLSDTETGLNGEKQTELAKGLDEVFGKAP